MSFKKSKVVFIVASIFMLVFARTADCQIKMIAAAFDREKQMLEKMWEARKAGEEEKVKKLGQELKDFVARYKKIAGTLKETTESAIKELEQEQAGEMSLEELAEKKAEIKELKGEIRALKYLIGREKFKYVKENRRDREDIKKWQRKIKEYKDKWKKEKKEIENDIKSYEKEIEMARESGEEQIKFWQKKIKEAKNDADKKGAREQLAKIRNYIADKSIKSHPGKVSMGIYMERLEGRKKHRVERSKKFEEGDYPGPSRGRTINGCKRRIARYEKQIAERKEEFVSGEFGRISRYNKRLNRAKVKLAALLKKTGLKSERMAKLEETKKTLELFLNHDFVTELPKEDSTFVKALKWLGKTAAKINKGIEKFKAIKKVVDLVKNAANPFEAADFLFEKAFGKSIVSKLAEKLLPEKLVKNKLFQSYINGGISERNLLKEVGKNLGDKVIDEKTRKMLETIDDLRKNPRSYLESELYDEVNTVIEANPEIASAIETMQKTKDVIECPEILYERMQEEAVEKVKSEFKNKIEDTQLQKKVKEIEQQFKQKKEKFEKIKDESYKKADEFANRVTGRALNHLKEKFESRMGMKTREAVGFYADIIEQYELESAQ